MLLSRLPDVISTWSILLNITTSFGLICLAEQIEPKRSKRCLLFDYYQLYFGLATPYPSSPFNCPGVLSSSHSFQIFFHPIRSHLPLIVSRKAQVASGAYQKNNLS